MLNKAFNIVITSLPDKPCILIFRNLKDKTALLFVCKSAIAKYCELMQLYVQKRLNKTQREFFNNYEHLEVEATDIVSTTEDMLALKILALSHKRSLIANGYNLLNNKVYIRPEVKLTYSISRTQKERLCYVEMQSNNRLTKIVLGIFDERQAAKDFISQYYASKPYYLCIANNALTKQFYLNEARNNPPAKLRI